MQDYKSWDDIKEIRKSDQEAKYVRFLKWFEETKLDLMEDNGDED